MSTSVPVPDYDLILTGGSLAACERALAAANDGSRCLLISAETFLAVDLTATLRAWTEDDSPLQLGALKRRWYDDLRAAGVTVLLGVQPVAWLADGDQTFGVVIATESGLQALTAARAEAVPLAAPDRAVFRLEYQCPALPADALTGPAAIPLPAIAELAGPVTVRRALGGENLAIVELMFESGPAADWPDRQALNLAARSLACRAGEALCAEHPWFADARVGRSSLRVLTPGETDAPAARWQWRDLTARRASEHNVLGVRYYDLDVPPADALPLLDSADVLVVGGGTAGAPAAIAAAETGASTLLVEASHALGGTGCAGGINQYYHGWRDGGFTPRIDRRVNHLTGRISPGDDLTSPVFTIFAKEMALLDELRELGGRVLFRTLLVDAIVEDGRVTGAIVASPDGLGRIACKVAIDATGDGDLAARAGVPCVMADPRGGNVQTYNQCPWRWRDLRGNGRPRFDGLNVDIGVIDNRDWLDNQRAIAVGHANGGDYDFSHMPVVRESRHIEGAYQFTLRDAFMPRRYADTIAMARTDFDQHGLQGTALARLGFLPYHDRSFTMAVPYRISLPRRLDGLLVTAKALSASKDGFSFLRMQPDLQNIGYATGLAAGLAANAGCAPRDVPLPELQRRLVEAGVLPAEQLTEADALLADPADDLATVLDGDETTFYRVLLHEADAMVPLLRRPLAEGNDHQRLLAAMALAWFGRDDGLELILDELAELAAKPQASSWDKAGRPVGGFRTIPDTYWRVNQLIVLCGILGDRRALPLLCRLAAATDAGGEVHGHERLHWRRIPNYDRIVSLCTALEAMADATAAPALAGLLDQPLVGGWLVTGSLDEDSTYASALLEVTVARTLARCGGTAGALRLADYLDDVRQVLAANARDELIAVTGRDLGPDPAPWRTYLAANAPDVTPWAELELV